MLYTQRDVLLDLGAQPEHLLCCSCRVPCAPPTPQPSCASRTLPRTKMLPAGAVQRSSACSSDVSRVPGWTLQQQQGGLGLDPAASSFIHCL